MPDERKDPAPSEELRKRAEEQATQASERASEQLEALSPEQARKLVHDLRVHQIELEMQNEELRRIQDELAASQARYFDLYDLAPVGYLSLSEPGLIVEANLTLATMLGLDRSRGALLSQPLSRLILAEDQETYYFHRKQLLETGAPQVCELRLVRADGSHFWAKLDAAMAPPSQDEALCRIAVSDIARRKEAETDKAALQEQVNQAERLEMVGRLAGGVAHSLNNALMPILGYAELLLGEPGLGDAAKGFVDQITSAGERARELVQQLLAYGRKQMGVSTVVDLNETLAALSVLLGRTIREDISVRLLPSPLAPCVMGDEAQLEQAIVGLAVNAQDAMPDGGALTIEAKLVDVDAEGGAVPGNLEVGRYALLSVSDTGTGMSAETQSHVFEPFFSGGVLKSGPGLGLAMVHSLVEQHGGHIFVTSATGQGTTFEIYLPAVERPVELGANEKVAGAGERAPGGHACILLVEDDPSVRGLTRTILERLGYRVLVAATGAQALDLLQRCENPVHLVLADVVMPGMNGRDLVLAIQNDFPRVRALLMSGHADSVIAHRGVVDTGTNFIQKPFSIEALATKVRELLDA